MCRLSSNLGASTSWKPQGLSGPVQGWLTYCNMSGDVVWHCIARHDTLHMHHLDGISLDHIHCGRSDYIWSREHHKRLWVCAGRDVLWHVCGVTAMWVCVCLYVSMYVCVCLCMSMYVCVCLCISLYVYVCLCMSIRVYVCLCMSMYVCVYLCMSMCVYVFQNFSTLIFWTWQRGWLMAELGRLTCDPLCSQTSWRWHPSAETCSSWCLSWIGFCVLWFIVFCWVRLLVNTTNWI